MRPLLYGVNIYVFIPTFPFGTVYFHVFSTRFKFFMDICFITSISELVELALV